MIILLVALAWITTFIAMPRWLSGLTTIAVITAGGFLLVTGAASYYWDSHMREDSNDALMICIGAILMLLSRARHVIRLIAEIISAH